MARFPAPSEPEFDVVVFGAGGYTGRLVCEYLAQRCPASKGIRWAAAGRNREKIERALLGVGFSPGAAPILIADSGDPESLNALSARTRVVATTVGPYAKLGSGLVESCVRQGTDYCDLTGEVHWMRAMIDRHASAAAETGARIVHACGFDSVPSDLGVWLVQQHALARHDEPCRRIWLLVRAMQGGLSGGTIASMLNAVDEAAHDRAVRRILSDPYALNPAGRREGPDGPDQIGMRFLHEVGQWTAPYVMERINTRIVRRTNALLNFPYGDDFCYHEAVITGGGLIGFARSSAWSALLTGFQLLAAFDFPREMLLRPWLPKPGEGPSEGARQDGHFQLGVIGLTDSGDQLSVTISGDQDPGYGATSRMLAESALCLAQDPLDVSGGFWTPAAAMADPLLNRLQTHGGIDFAIA